MGKIDKSTFDALIGQGLGPRRMDYTWRDVALPPWAQSPPTCPTSTSRRAS